VRNSAQSLDALTVRSSFHFACCPKPLPSGASGQIRKHLRRWGRESHAAHALLPTSATPHALQQREPGSGCSRARGHNRIHAVLGTAGRASRRQVRLDMHVAMVAQSTRSGHVRRSARRDAPFRFASTSFHTPHPERGVGTGSNTANDHGCWLSSTACPWSRRSHYRNSVIVSSLLLRSLIASAAVALDLDGAASATPRVALGGVVTTSGSLSSRGSVALREGPTPANVGASRPRRAEGSCARTGEGLQDRAREAARWCGAPHAARMGLTACLMYQRPSNSVTACGFSPAVGTSRGIGYDGRLKSRTAAIPSPSSFPSAQWRHG